MRPNIAIRLAIIFCLVTALLAFACLTPDSAGYAGVRIGRLCFYNGTCSRAIGASLLVYQQGEGSDVYFQPCAEMVENEATYLGGNQVFGFGKNFHPSRTWICLPSWLVAILWLWQALRSRTIQLDFRDENHARWTSIVVAVLSSIALFVYSPMLSITTITWLTIILFCSWLAEAMRHVRKRNMARTAGRNV